MAPMIGSSSPGRPASSRHAFSSRAVAAGTLIVRVRAAERSDERLELDGGERTHLLPWRRRHLAQRAHRVAGDVAVLDGYLQYAGQLRHRLADGVRRARVVQEVPLERG